MTRGADTRDLAANRKRVAELPANPRDRLACLVARELLPFVDTARGNFVWRGVTVVLPSGRVTTPSVVVQPQNVDRLSERDAAERVPAIVDLIDPEDDREELRERWADMQRLRALGEYVLVWTDRPRVAVWSRTPGGWARGVYTRGAAVLPRLRARIGVGAIYR